MKIQLRRLLILATLILATAGCATTGQQAIQTGPAAAYTSLTWESCGLATNCVQKSAWEDLFDADSAETWACEDCHHSAAPMTVETAGR